MLKVYIIKENVPEAYWDETFRQNSWRLSPENYFHKKLHLTYMIEFLIDLCVQHIDLENTPSRQLHVQSWQ